MVYQFDLQANEERKSAGTLLISLYCQNTDKVDPEEIEPIIRNTLKDVLLTPENGTPYAFSWARMSSSKFILLLHLFVLVLIHFFHLMNKTIPLINQQTIEFPIRS